MDTSTGSQEGQGKQEFDMTNSVQAVCRICGKTDKEHADPVPGENLSTQHFFEPDSVQAHGHLVQSELGNSISHHSHADGLKEHDHKPSVQAGKGTWHKLPDSLNKGMWLILVKIGDTPIKEMASNLYEWQADQIIADHERAAWAAEARDALLAVIKDYQFSAGKRELGQVYAASHPVINAVAVFARYPQQEDN